MSSVLWYPDADFTSLMPFRRDARLNLTSCIYWTDGFSSFFHLLSTCVMTLSMFSIPVTLHGLLGTPSNLELRKRRGVVRLAFNDVGLAGLVGDVDVNHVRDAARNGAVCAGLRRPCCTVVPPWGF